MVSGTVSALGVDISSYGTYKQTATVDLLGERTPVRLSVDVHDTSGGGLGLAGGLKKAAKGWYGKSGLKYASAAAIEGMLVSLAVQLSDPGTAGHSLFVAGHGPAP